MSSIRMTRLWMIRCSHSTVLHCERDRLDQSDVSHTVIHCYEFTL